MFVENYLGVTLDYDYLSNDHRYLGMTIFNDTNQLPIWVPEHGEAEYREVSAGTIIIDTYLEEVGNEGRRNYTLGHESWHWIGHQGYFSYNPNQMSLFEGNNEPFIQCRDIMTHRNIPSRTETWDKQKWMEWQADVFSAAFLMPKESVRILVAKNFSLPISDLINMVSFYFRVSKTAAKYRLIDLGIIKEESYDIVFSRKSVFDY